MDQGSSNANTAPSSSEATGNKKRRNVGSEVLQCYPRYQEESSNAANQECLDVKNQGFCKKQSFNANQTAFYEASSDEGSFNESPATKIKTSKKQKSLNAKKQSFNEQESFNTNLTAINEALFYNTDLFPKPQVLQLLRVWGWR